MVLKKAQLLEPWNSPQYDIANISRSFRSLAVCYASYYCEPKNGSEYNMHVMKVIDRIYLEHPECGSGLMSDMLYRDGYTVNRKRVRRLMKLMALEAIY